MRDIKADIFDCGRKLFGSRGFKDTNIFDITVMVGIGIGTFYKYYASKEKLFFEVYKNEIERIRNGILESVDMNDDPVALVTKLVVLNISAMNSNLILKEWYNEELFNKLEQYYYEQVSEESFEEFIHSDAAHVIKNLKYEGKIRGDVNYELIMAFLNSLYYIDAYKKEIGIEHFPQILRYITELIMKGLIDSPR